MLWSYEKNNLIYQNYISAVDNTSSTPRLLNNFIIDYLNFCNILKCIPHPTIIKLYKLGNIYTLESSSMEEFSIDCINNLQELQEKSTSLGVQTLYFCNISLDAATMHCISLALKGNTEIKTFQYFNLFNNF